MNFITAIIDSLVGFVQRNPLTTLLIVILALGAPFKLYCHSSTSTSKRKLL